MTLAEKISRIVPRARAFYRATEPGHFLVSAHFPVDRPKRPLLSSLDLDRQLGEWMESKLANMRPVWNAKADLDDDMIPSICPSFGTAEHSAWLGQEVRQELNTCIARPCMSSLRDMDKLTMDEHARWFRYMKEGYDYLRQRKGDEYALAVRGTMSPMDIANAVRGDEILTDVLLDPEAAHMLCDFLVRAMRWYYQHMLSWVDPIEDGHVFMYGSSWAGPKCIGHLGNDMSMMCSPDVYAEFGFPYETRVVEGYDRIIYHYHSERLHSLPQVAKLPGMALLEVAHDPQTPEIMEDLPRIFAATGKAGLMLAGTSDEVRRHIDELKQRNVFLQINCRDAADARDIIAFVRSHSRP